MVRMKLGFRQSWNWGLEGRGTLSLSPLKFMDQPHFSMIEYMSSVGQQSGQLS